MMLIIHIPHDIILGEVASICGFGWNHFFKYNARLYKKKFNMHSLLQMNFSSTHPRCC